VGGGFAFGWQEFHHCRLMLLVFRLANSDRICTALRQMDGNGGFAGSTCSPACE